MFIVTTEKPFPQLKTFQFCFSSTESDRQSWIRAIKESAIAQQQQQQNNNNSLMLTNQSLPSNDLLDKIDSALNEHWKNLNGTSTATDTAISTMNNGNGNGNDNQQQQFGIDNIQQQQQQSRSNTIIHVCWQRNCTITNFDYRYALTVSFSGYLLRKFKNSSGWQKLWVEFTHFCLFFYKTAEVSLTICIVLMMMMMEKH